MASSHQSALAPLALTPSPSSHLPLRLHPPCSSWAIIGLKAGGAKPLAYVKALGDTPLADLMSRFADDEVAFAIVKVMGVDPKGAVVSRRTKGIFFTWIGEKATRLVKMQANPARSALASYFRGHAVSLEVFDRADPINEVELEKRLRACGGAHQPERFDFPAGAPSSVVEFTPETQPALYGEGGAPGAA